MLVLLMGLRACGKSTIAPLLAQQLGCGWSDLDNMVARRLGASSVREAWNTHGVGLFRDTEAHELAGLLDRHAPIAGQHDQAHQPARRPHVVALGGGTPTAPGVPAMLDAGKREHRCVVVYLRARPQSLQARLRAGSTPQAREPGVDESDMLHSRPSLTGADPIDEVPVVCAQRDPLYVKLADVVVEVDDLPVQETLLEVRAQLTGMGRLRGLV